MVNRRNPLTVTVPEGAVCGLYPGIPGNLNYFLGIDPEKAIPATEVSTAEGLVTYTYEGLEPGLYHCGVTKEGCNAVCQMIHHTEAAVVDIRPDKLVGGGYEAGYVTLNTQAFTDKQLLSHKNAWGPEYTNLFRTPQFLRDRFSHQQTTNEELAAFIAKLAATCENMYVFSLGVSPKYGYDMPLVLFTRENIAGKTLEQAAEVIRGNGKPTVQYTAQCHSTEPASCEGALAMMLQLCGDYGERVLDTVDIYIIPRINPDGAFEVKRVSPTTGEDMNRDYLRTSNKEVRMVIGAYNLFLPEVAIDGHEKRHYPLAEDTNTCNDMELQTGAGSLNHPAEMTQMTMEMALFALTRGKELGLRGHFYTKLASAAGGSAGSSYFGTRNSLSFLIETPGQTHLGMAFMERRVLSQYVPASAIIDYTVKYAPQILALVHSSRERMVKKGAFYTEDDTIVLEHDKGETGAWIQPLISVPTGKVVDAEHRVPYLEHTVALRSRIRPTAYILPKGLENEEEILRVTEIHGASRYAIPEGSVVRLKRYMRTEEDIRLTEEREFCFPEGAWVFPNTLPSTVLSVIMEPDFNAVSGRKMTLLSMGLISADTAGCLPIYRYCRDLNRGEVTLEG